jgi:LytS/YehU family sensor histidine kinase
MWFGNENISHSLDKRIQWTKEPTKRFVWGVIAMVVYTVLATLLLRQIAESIFDIGMGNMTNMLYLTVLITFVITLFMTSRSFLLCWRQTAIDAEKLMKENFVARFENLKIQVNPHFLFNSFNALTNLVYEDQDKAAKFIKKLSDVYRYVLDTRDREVVSLEEEMDFLKSYVFLQQIRFGEKLKIDIQLNGIKSMVAPLALQMLIENAIKHNVVSEESPLTVKVYADDQYLAVENDLQKKVILSEDKSGVGLDNIRKRYEFLTGREIVIQETPEKFIVRLPFITELSQP